MAGEFDEKGQAFESQAQANIAAALEGLGLDLPVPLEDPPPPAAPLDLPDDSTLLAGLAPPPARKKKSVNPNAGHRDRLRERFRLGVDSLPDYEILELVLFQSIPQRDVKPLAKELIRTFGSFSEVCHASIPDLCTVKGISETTATNLQVIRAAALRMQKDAIMDRPVLGSWQALLDYVRSAMQFQRTEDFRVLYLDRKNRLVADVVVASGTVDRAPVYPREILKRVLSLDASAVILVHNHPSGDPTPSHADVEMTKTLVELCAALDTVVHDHLVVGRERVVSFKQLGLL